MTSFSVKDDIPIRAAVTGHENEVALLDERIRVRVVAELLECSLFVGITLGRPKRMDCRDHLHVSPDQVLEKTQQINTFGLVEQFVAIGFAQQELCKPACNN